MVAGEGLFTRSKLSQHLHECVVLNLLVDVVLRVARTAEVVIEVGTDMIRTIDLTVRIQSFYPLDYPRLNDKSARIIKQSSRSCSGGLDL